MGHENEARASMYVRLFKHFGYWNTNGLADRDDEDTIRRAWKAERR